MGRAGWLRLVLWTLLVALPFGGCSFNLAGDGAALSGVLDGSISLDGSRAELFVVSATELEYREADVPPVGVFTVKLAQAPSTNVTIPVRVTPNGRFESIPKGRTPETITFTPENWSTPQEVPFSANRNSEIDPPVFTVELGAATSGDSLFAGADPPDVRIAFVDANDAISISPLVDGQGKNLSVSEAQTTTRFYVVLGATPTGDVQVTCTSENESEVVVAAASAAVADAGADASDDAGDGGVTSAFAKQTTFTFERVKATAGSQQEIIVKGVDDDVADKTSHTKIVCRAQSANDPRFAGKEAKPITIDNVDDESANILVYQTTLNTTESGGVAQFEINLATRPSADVTVNFTNPDPTEGSLNPTSVVFKPAEWDKALRKVVTVTGVNDDIFDGPITYTISASSSTADPEYASLPIAGVLVTNADDEVAAIDATVQNPPLTTAESNGTTRTIRVRLRSQPLSNVVVDVSSNNTAEANVSKTQLTFTPADYSVEQTVDVTGVQDNPPRVDGAQGYTIHFEVSKTAAGNDPMYLASAGPTNLAGQNADDDVAALQYTGVPVALNEGSSKVFSINLATQPAQGVTVNIGAPAVARGVIGVSPGSLFFSSSDWNVPKNVTVTSTDDCIAGGNGGYVIPISIGFTLDPAYALLNPPDVTLNFTNNDSVTPGFAVTPTSNITVDKDGGTATFTVNLTTQPISNVQVNVASSDSTIATAAPSKVTFGSGGTACPSAQTVTITGEGKVGNFTITLSNGGTSDPDYGGNPPDVTGKAQ